MNGHPQKTAFLLYLAAISLMALALTGCGNLPFVPNPQPTPPQTTTEQPPEPTAQQASLAETEAKRAQLKQATDAGDNAKAIALATDILIEQPGDLHTRNSLGLAYAQTQQWDKAIQELNQVLELDPKHPYALSTLAWAYAEKQQWPQAMDASKRAIEANPNNPHAYANLGWALSATGKPTEAIAAYEKAINADPKLGSAYYSLGVVYCDMGNAAKANETLGKVKPIDNGSAQQLSARIGQGCNKK